MANFDFWENMTPRARKILELARNEAERFGHDHIGSEHLLLGILALNEGVAVDVLKSFDLNLERLRFAVEQSCDAGKSTCLSGDLPITQRLENIIGLAFREAQTMNYKFIGSEHFLLALLKEGSGQAARILRKLGVDFEEARRRVTQALDPDYLPEEEPNGDADGDSDGDNDFEPNPDSEDDEPASREQGDLPALNTFGRNLTAAARRGELDPVIGRQDEIERVMQILCRRTKNNPVLIGEAGVGKTAILEGLAEAIVAKRVPELLLDKQIYAVDLPLMVAGTKYRGQFEERIKDVIDEVKSSGKIILFIDELHTLVGAGGAEGAMDAANIIKPALSRGELQCVGATTLDEYRKSIEKDAALERRFQSVIVNPPNIEDSIKILDGLKSTYEKHHKIKYTKEALEAAVRLSDRYISGRFLPDKAIDIIDEAGARAHISVATLPPDFSDIDKALKKVVADKEAAANERNFELAALKRDEEKRLRQVQKTRLDNWRKQTREKNCVVGVEEIKSVVAKLTGIPLQQMSEGENSKLLRMEEELKRVVVGQEYAISAITKALRRSRADLKNPSRPIGSFIFLGPTGVGKTLLAKTLAEFMFGNSDALIQIDMSEYMEKFNVSRLVGSPPGYVGYGEGGELTERVRRHPYSVVLFDEIEKAHPDVMHTLLQILEDGHITDTLGRRIDFCNTIIIMTSNVGAAELAKGAVLGFKSDEKVASIQFCERLRDMAKKTFKPEFINRVDEVVVFNKLDKKDLCKIVDIEVAKLANRVKDRGLQLVVSDAAKNFIVEHGFEPEYGARPIRRAVEGYLENRLAEELLRGTFANAMSIEVDVADNELFFIAKNEAQLI